MWDKKNKTKTEPSKTKLKSAHTQKTKINNSLFFSFIRGDIEFR